MKHPIHIFLGASFLALVLLGSGLSLASGPAQTATATPSPTLAANPTTPPGAATPPLRTVSVSGIGQVSAAPDQARVRLGVQTEATTAVKALADNTTKMTALLNALTKASVARADIQTQNLTLFPRFDQPSNTSTPPKLIGYTASNTVEVRVRNLDTLGQLIDAAVAAGSNSIESVQFEVNDASGSMDEARKEAMADARHRAEQLATLSGATLDKVLSLNEFTGSVPSPLLREGVSASGAQAAIEPGTQTVEVTVQVTWVLR